MKHIKKEKLSVFLEALTKDLKVYAPIKTNDVVKFLPWQKEAVLELETNTNIPPKDILFPQTEDMYSFKNVDGKTLVEGPAPQEQQVLFGVRACDVKSFSMMDDVFLTKGFEDNYYKDKRENTILIGLACNKLQPSCFCTSMGVLPQDADGVDVNLLDAGNSYTVVAKTSKGEELLNKYAAFFEEGNDVTPCLPDTEIKVSVEGLAPKLAKMFEHEVWEELYKKCIGCGTCTFLCPTCHCFDISGKNAGDTGIKFRCWDTCMFSEYTRMAGGHNPRPSRKERFRNRFLHKLQYFPERYGKTACVGCGRCIVKCPVGVDITRIIDRLQEVDANV